MNFLAVEKEFIPHYPTSLVEQVTQFLANAIMEGRIKSGERIVENGLQRRFKISRAPNSGGITYSRKDRSPDQHPTQGLVCSKNHQERHRREFYC